MSSLIQPLPAFDSAAYLPLRRIGSLGLIVLLHFAFFYALTRGLAHEMPAPVTPREIFASFITPEPAARPEESKPVISKPETSRPETPKPVPPKPKASAVVKNTAPRPAATTPAADPSPSALSTPASAAAEPAAAAQTAAAAPAASAPASTASAAPAPPAPPKTISGVEYVQPPQPVYPPLAKRAGEQGKVILRILVSQQGRPERADIQTSSGFARLDEAARQAAMRALFRPHMEDGRPVAVFALVPINFSIQ